MDVFEGLRMFSGLFIDNSVADWALFYRLNIVVRGRNATPMENK
jgi:protocatechuate 3,4-dioxygenase beta subunit